jgi:hypothetical protein
MNIFLKSITIMLGLIAGLPAMEYENTNPGNCLPEIALIFLTEVVKDEYVSKDFTDFQESACLLKSVCSNWNKIIDKKLTDKAMLLGCQQICPEFLKGKLIYRPTEGSDEGMIELKISDLLIPLGGEFDLSQCGDTGMYLCISTGYRKVQKAENLHKIEIWLTPRFLVEKELKTTAGHFKAIFPSKWNDGASVGMFWVLGALKVFDRYEYLTSESIDNLSKINVFENWKKSNKHATGYIGTRMCDCTAEDAMLAHSAASRFVFELK